LVVWLRGGFGSTYGRRRGAVNTDQRRKGSFMYDQKKKEGKILLGRGRKSNKERAQGRGNT